VLAIPGTGNPDHLAENIAAGTLRLSADELAKLEGGNPHLLHPGARRGCMWFSLCASRMAVDGHAVRIEEGDLCGYWHR
jgi:hypothetical protein